MLSGDREHPVIRITRPYVPHLFLLQLQRYNGLGDQVPAISILLLRYVITIIVYAALSIFYLWLRFQYGFTNITIERVFIVIAIGVVINVLSSGLYYIISALSRPVEEVAEVKIEEKPVIDSSMLYKMGQPKDVNGSTHRSDDIMNIYKYAAPVLAKMQRNDFNVKPFYIAYRRGNEDFYLYEDSFNVMGLMRVVNEIPVMDEREGMIEYCIYYKDGKNFHKTEYLTRDRLKILTKAVLSIYTNENK